MYKTIAVDMDQTLTQDFGYNPYPPLGKEMADYEMIDWVNEKSRYNHIVIYTARNSDIREETEQWLDDKSVEYDELVMGKLDYDILVDDKAVSPETAKDEY